MSLADQTTPVTSWVDGGKPTISIVCHCGESFALDDLDAARAHVESHGPVDEPA